MMPSMLKYKAPLKKQQLPQRLNPISFSSNSSVFLSSSDAVKQIEEEVKPLKTDSFRIQTMNTNGSTMMQVAKLAEFEYEVQNSIKRLQKICSKAIQLEQQVLTIQKKLVTQLNLQQEQLDNIINFEQIC